MGYVIFHWFVCQTLQMASSGATCPWLDAGGGKTAVAKLDGAIVRCQRVLYQRYVYQEHKATLFTGRSVCQDLEQRTQGESWNKKARQTGLLLSSAGASPVRFLEDQRTVSAAKRREGVAWGCTLIPET